MKLSLHLKLLGIAVLLATAPATSQNCPAQWEILDACGPILANGGIAPNSPPIFCEGQEVTFLNTTASSLGITRVYIDWGDGTCESFAGNPPQFTHKYDIPDDSCVSVSSVIYNLHMGVEKSCGGSQKSFHYIITPLAVRYKPVADPAIPPTVCQGDPLWIPNKCQSPFNANAVWTTSEGLTISGGVFTGSFSTPGVHTLTMSVNNGCGEDAATVPVTVIPVATASAAFSDTALCLPNAVLNITNNSLHTWGQVWSVTPNTGYQYLNGTNHFSFNPVMRFTQPGDYTVKLEAAGCGNPVITRKIRVNAQPLVALTPLPDYCNQASLDPNNFFSFQTGGPGAAVSWVFSGGSLASHVGQNAPVVHFPNIGVYAITAAITNQCGTATRTDTFQVAAPATAQAALSATTICAGADALTVNNQSVNAQGFQWSVSPAPWGNYAAGTSPQSASPVFQFTEAGEFVITLQAQGCNSPVWRDTLEVKKAPELAWTQSLPDGCNSLTFNPTAFLTFNPDAIQTIQWTFTGGSPAQAAGFTPPAVTFTDPGSHAVAVTALNECGTATLIDSILIYNPPEVTLLPPPDTVCQGTSPFLLQASPAGGIWTGPGVSPEGSFDPAQAFPNGWNHLVYRVGPPGCRNQDTVKVFVHKTNVGAGPDMTLCANDPTVPITTFTPVNGIWTGPGITQPGGWFDPAIAGSGVHTLTYTVNDPYGCTVTATRTATVLPPPVASLLPVPDQCMGVPVDFQPYYQSADAQQYQWMLGDGSVYNGMAPVHTYTSAGLYPLQLVVSDAAGCRDTAMGAVTVLAPPQAGLMASVSEGCGDLAVSFTNLSQPLDGISFTWNFGNGNTAIGSQSGTTVYPLAVNDTVYTATLTAENSCGISTATRTIQVNAPPRARFGPNVDDGCSPLQVQFNNISSDNAVAFQWYINDQPVFFGAQLPAQTFVAPEKDSVYTIALVAMNACGSDTLYRQVVVHANPVDAFIGLDTTKGCAPLSIQAYNFSTQGHWANWDFGDGNQTVGDTVQHQYTEPGVYTLRLSVNNGCGADSAEAHITVLESPQARFSTVPAVCQSDTLVFQNESASLAGYSWNFGDGSPLSVLTSPSHVYTQPGTYQAVLTVTAATNGCTATFSRPVVVRKAPEAVFQLDAAGGCVPFTIAPVHFSGQVTHCLWDFGDGATSTSTTPVHTYQQSGTYTLRLSVKDEFGCSGDTVLHPVNAFPVPELSFVAHQGPLCRTPVAVTFYNTSQYGDAYVWRFGTGDTTTAVQPVLNMPSGPLAVQLTGSNIYGCQSVLDTLVNIYNEPIVDVAANIIQGCMPLTVTFENYSAAVNHFLWSFGDGSADTSRQPTHTFTRPGMFRVVLVAGNDSICFDSTALNILVQETPTADFSFQALTDTTVSANGIYLFQDRSTAAKTWHWDFGDGSTSDERHPLHRYWHNGPTVVTLRVQNNNGCPDTVSRAMTPEVFGGLFIPNAFAPETGGDGAREFKPVGAGIQQFRIEVFAANGQRMWMSEKLHEGQPAEGWDGKYLGEYCPPGIYFWKCEAFMDSQQSWPGMVYPGETEPLREGKLLLIR